MKSMPETETNVFLPHKPACERTEEELDIAFQLYIASKTVNGRYCPTPDLMSPILDSPHTVFTYDESNNESNNESNHESEQ
tara:strand:+ start:36 stop:278 length:243 start_codon:yes stop_codon:yes gene_type:complete